MAEGVAGRRGHRPRPLHRVRAGRNRGVPDAVQVLDRWHALRNAREVAERLLERHPDQPRAPGTPVSPAAPPALPPRRSGHEEARRAGARGRTIERHEAVQRPAAAGLSERALATRLGIARGTVRRGGPASWPQACRTSGRRWAEGCRNGCQLWQAIRERVAFPARASRSRAGHRHVALPWRPPPRVGTGHSPARRRHRPRRPPGAAYPLGDWPACLRAACPDAAAAGPPPSLQAFVR